MELVFKEKVFLILVVWLLSGAAFCTFQPAPLPAEPEPRPVFASAADQQEHYRLLKKHGLTGEVAVILRDPLGDYYIRNGRRYAFR